MSKEGAALYRKIVAQIVRLCTLFSLLLIFFFPLICRREEKVISGLLYIFISLYLYIYCQITIFDFHLILSSNLAENPHLIQLPILLFYLNVSQKSHTISLFQRHMHKFSKSLARFGKGCACLFIWLKDVVIYVTTIS